MKTVLHIWLATIALTLGSTAGIVTNGGFESGLAGWRPLWTRDDKVGTLVLDSSTAHSGQQSARLDHRGEKDWSLEPALRVSVQAGDVFELEAWLKLDSRGGSATLCVSTHDAQGKALDWSYGERSLHDSAVWQRVRTRFIVPPGVALIQPRLIGRGPTVVWLDDFSLEKSGHVSLMPPTNLPRTLAITNSSLEVALNTSNATLTVRDRRTGQRFAQAPLSGNVILTGATSQNDQFQIQLIHVASGQEILSTIRLEKDSPEFTVELAAQGDLPGALQFPHPFASRPGEYLVVPMNEGISYPVEDSTIEPFSLVAYGGHGICMAFWGATDGAQGHMAIIETPDDASIRIERQSGLLAIAPEWEPQHGQFGYTRRLRYIFFNQGGHVAMAKRYRAYAQKIGLFKTLEQKRRETPNVDRLIGAVNVWCWDRDAVGIVKELQSAGIERILWSNAQSPENLRALNDLGVLTSRYDIYQDVMDPANFPRLNGGHGDWVTDAWPADIICKASGDWLRGWGVKGKQGEWFYCGVLCDRRALDYAARRIPAELTTHPYLCRFIDTTTAAPWQECYDTNHPMTRTDSKTWKMKLIDYVSRDNELVTGSETGHDAAVPFLHYFEGMMSLGPYRVPDAGRDMARIWTNAPERVVKFQLGHQYRLPLWELVYHECVVAQWYWGDYNNKLPMLWDKRDLFNVLYATPPMFMFNRALWQENQSRFVQSYRNTCPLVRRVGYSEMTDHRFLAPDRSVQQTAFANGATVTVNFGPTAFRLPDGTLLEPMEFRVK
jgi:Glycosyl hydrolases related to GH101 family, GH129